MNTKWILSVRALFTSVYGAGKGAKVCDVVIPAVMGDFRKTALAAPLGETVTERYRTDDSRTDITITGCHQAENTVSVTGIRVGGTPADLGPDPLIL